MIRRLLLALTLCVVVGGQPVAGQIQHTAPGYTESEIKAAFIVNLFAFIQWPAGEQPSTLCVTQRDATSSALKALLTARPNLGVELVELNAGLASAEPCSVVYISRGSETDKAAVIANGPKLTISDQQGFARSGGMVELERRPNRVGLVLNHKALEAAGFQVSSKLLALAKVVETGGDDGA